jgi:hypothetical protein
MDCEMKILSFLILIPLTVAAQVPSAPTNLVVTNGSGNNINLSWSDNSSNEISFKIERKLGTSETYAQIDTVSANVTSYADVSSKTANRPYIYKVRASNGSGDSAYTNEDDATTPFLGTIDNYKTDAANYLESPVTMPLPLAGGKFYDEVFGTLLMKFTDNTSDGGCFGTNYSVWSTSNRDNTKLFMFNQCIGNYWIGTFNPTTFERVGALQLVANAPSTLFAHYESAFWSFLDSDKLFIIVDAKLYYYRPSTNTYTLVKDFTSNFPAGYFFIQLYVSSNDNRFAMMVRNSASDQGFIVYELSTNTIKLDFRTTDMNGITMDKSGRYVIYVPDNSFADQRMYDADTGTFDTLTSNISTGEPDFIIGHNDTGQDLIVSNDPWHGGFSSRKMSTPHTIAFPFIYAPFWINNHVSLRANDDRWALISTFGEVSVSADTNKYHSEIFQIGVSGAVAGNVRRLFHNRSKWISSRLNTISNASNTSPIVITTPTAHGFLTGQRVQVSGVGGNTAANGTRIITVINSTQFSINNSVGNGTYTSGGQAYVETYWEIPKANISRDGKFVFFTSNWNGIPGSNTQNLFIAQIKTTERKCNWHTGLICN